MKETELGRYPEPSCCREVTQFNLRYEIQLSQGAWFVYIMNLLQTSGDELKWIPSAAGLQEFPIAAWVLVAEAVPP